MSDKPIPPIPPGILTQEELDAIAGGGCAAEWVAIADKLKDAYESIVDLTVYVAERVTGKQ
jgi:hypothetical protein